MLESFDHGSAVLFVAHTDTDGGITGSIDDELEVHGEGLAIEHDPELFAVADPLCAREEGLEAAAQRLFVARSTAAPRGSACAVLEENVRDECIAEIDSMISTY